MIEIIRQEAKYHLARPVIYLLLILCALLCSFDLSNQSAYHTVLTSFGYVERSAPWAVTQSVLTLQVLSFFFIAFVSGNSITKDFDHRTGSIYLSLPISRGDYFFGRFIGSFLISSLFLLSAILGSVIALLPKNAGVLPIISITQALLLAAPAFLIVHTALFTLSAFTRNQQSVLLLSLTLVLGSFYMQGFAKNIDRDYGPHAGLVAALTDFSGLSLITLKTQHWSLAEKNNLNLLQDVDLYLRLSIWTCLSTLLVWLSFIAFRRGPLNEAKASPRIYSQKAEFQGLVAEPQIAKFGLPTFIRQFFALSLFEWKRLSRNLLFIVLTVMLSSQVYSNFFKNVANQAIMPTSSLFISEGMAGLREPLTILALLLAGVAMWREKDAHSQGIFYAYPIPNAVLVLAKFSAIILTIACIQVIILLLGLATQFYFQFTLIDYSAYFVQFFGIDLLSVATCTGGFLLIQQLSPNKYVGFGVSILLVIISITFSESVTLSWLPYFGFIPSPAYSEVSGFSPVIEAVPYYQVFWLSVLALIFLISQSNLQREERYFTWIKSFWKRLLNKTIVFPLLIVVMILSGSLFLLHKAQHTGGGWGILEEEMKALYELRYKKYLNTKQPVIKSTKINADLFPARRMARISGTMTFVNSTSAWIDTIFVNCHWSTKIKLSRSAIETTNDREAGVILYKLMEPLKEGDSLLVTFVSDYTNPSANIRESDNYIVEEGLYISNFQTHRANLFPRLGYDSWNILSNPETRSAFSLPALTGFYKPLEDSTAKRQASRYWTTLEIIVSTASSHTVVCSGTLVETWQEKDRNYFHYASDGRISDEWAIVSGSYEHKSITMENTNLKFFYKRNHDENIASMLEGIRQGFLICNDNFGKYPYKTLSVVEVPDFGLISGTAISKPTLILWNERGGFFYDSLRGNGINRVFSTAAHEVSHQWWSHRVKPAARVEGGAVLNEMLAQYVRWLALKEKYKAYPKQLEDFLEGEEYFYQYGKSESVEAELPLYKSDQGFVMYNKGTIVMKQLADIMGDSLLLIALNKYSRKFEWANSEFPTTIDLINYLKAETPPSQYNRIDSLFTKGE